jgi:hypothetical protein
MRGKCNKGEERPQKLAETAEIEGGDGNDRGAAWGERRKWGSGVGGSCAGGRSVGELRGRRLCLGDRLSLAAERMEAGASSFTALSTNWPGDLFSADSLALPLLQAVRHVRAGTIWH